MTVAQPATPAAPYGMISIAQAQARRGFLVLQLHALSSWPALEQE